jgi:tetratricopeptide (TPR) repeat protein
MLDPCTLPGRFGVILIPIIILTSCRVERISDRADLHLQRCATLFAEGLVPDAIAHCELAIEYAPYFAEAYNMRALIEISEGERDAAREDLKLAISYKRDFAEAYNNLGKLELDAGELDYACDLFKQALEIDPGYVVARRNHASCLLANGDPEEAHKEFRRCVALPIEDCDCRMGLGATYLAREDLHAALKQYERAVVTCPQRPEAHYNLCWAYAQGGLCAEAVTYCQQAVNLSPDYQQAKDGLALAQRCRD